LQGEVLAAILEGKPRTQIATELGVSRGAVAAYAKKISNPAQSLQSRQDVKGAIRLEISQENALSDLADQMKEYTDRYEKAIKGDDMKAAYAWSSRRVELLEKMLKVTGLYEAPTTKEEPIEIRFIEVSGRDRQEEVRAAIVKALAGFPEAKIKALRVLEEMDVVMRSTFPTTEGLTCR
jgi:predicted transcriptional regulator